MKNIYKMGDDNKMDVDQDKIKDTELKDKKLTEEKSTKKDNEKEKSEKKENSSKKNDKIDDMDKDLDKKSDTNKKVDTKDGKSTIDREKVCPFLLRVFCKKGSHHRIEDFTINRQPVEDEIQIYTWKDASLRELASLLAEIDPQYAKHNTVISFKSVYLDNIRARYNSKDLGVINTSKPSATDDATLDENKFIIGDFIDVSVQPYSDVRRRYSYDRQDSFGGMNNRLGGGNRFGNNGPRNGGLSFDRKRKGKIGERHDRFSPRRGSFRNERGIRN